MTTQTDVQHEGARITCFHSNPELVIYRIGTEWFLQNGYSLGQRFENLPAGPERGPHTNRQSRRARNTVAVLAGLFTLIGIGIFGWGLSNVTDAETHSGLGDFFAGTVGPLWALAGVALVYVAFRGQQEQARVQEEQIQTAEQNARLQQFESAFFQLLNLHNQIVRELRIEASIALSSGVSTTRVFTGRDVLDAIYSELQSRYFSEIQRLTDEEGEDVHGYGMNEENQLILRIYEPLHQERQGELGHYFRNLYTITKYVVESGIPDPQRYINIIRAQLSSDELLMLFYNCLSRWGIGPFKQFVEDFHMLHNLPVEHLLSPLHQRQYASTAFGDRDQSASGHEHFTVVEGRRADSRGVGAESGTLSNSTRPGRSQSFESGPRQPPEPTTMEGDVKETIATILQSRMDKCTSEQFWAAGVVAALDAYLIAQREEIIEVVPKYIVIGLTLIVGAYAWYFVVDRHKAYYRFVDDLATVLEGEASVPASIKTRWQPWEGHSWSGVLFYVGVVVIATIGVIVFYR